MQVAIRTDAAEHIGSGHVMRCLTLASALRSRGAQVLFLCRDHVGHLAARIRERGFSCALLGTAGTDRAADLRSSALAHAAWLGVDWRTDLMQTQAALGAIPGVDLLVIDHYALDASWEAGMRDRARKILVIDDLADRRHLADVLLDQNFGSSASAYRDLVPSECVLLIGSGYALLRPEFAALRARSLARRSKVAQRLSILISFGGFDPDNLTALAIESLAALDPSRIERITVLLSEQAPHFSHVVSVAQEGHLPIEVMPYTTRIAELMCAADLAIGGAGTTSWERCTLGLPSVLVVLAENQLRAAMALQQAGACLLAGRSLDVTAEKLAQCVGSMLADETALRGMVEKAAAICDGLGVERVVGALT